MPISGTLINCALIIVGTLLGIAAKKVLPEHVKDTMMHAVGLIVMFIGIGGAVSASLTYADGIFGTKDTLVMILSMTLGAALGDDMVFVFGRGLNGLRVLLGLCHLIPLKVFCGCWDPTSTSERCSAGLSEALSLE